MVCCGIYSMTTTVDALHGTIELNREYNLLSTTKIGPERKLNHTHTHTHARRMVCLRASIGWLWCSNARMPTTKFKWKRRTDEGEPRQKRTRANRKQIRLSLFRRRIEWQRNRARDSKWSYLNRFSIDAAPKIRPASSGRKKQQECTWLVVQ